MPNLFLLLTFGVTSCLVIEKGSPEAISLLKWQNDYRSGIAKGEIEIKDGVMSKKAANMKRLEWDASLAIEAERIALTEPAPEFNQSGVNLFHATVPKANFMSTAYSAVLNWKIELADLGWTPEYLGSTDFIWRRRGAQLIWAETSRVGCAFHQWENHNTSIFYSLIACKYGPIVAENGSPKGVYQVGETCSSCPVGTKCEISTGLCLTGPWSNAMESDSMAAETILNFHNFVRSSAARGKLDIGGVAKEPAANMMKLKWNPQLAERAYERALKHPTTFFIDGSLYHEINTNLTPTMAAMKAFANWSSELSTTNWSVTNELTVEQYNTMSNGVWMIWAVARQIGCAFHQWVKEGGEKHTVVICMYHCGQDYVAMPRVKVYEVGVRCEKCPNGSDCDVESGLCVENEEVKL